MPPKRTTTPMTDVAIKALIAQSIVDALAEHEANRSNEKRYGRYDSRSGGKRTKRTTCECTYKEFLNCQPLNFKGTKGVVSLTQWFEKMEYVFRISNCTVECQCNPLGSGISFLLAVGAFFTGSELLLPVGTL
nr:hypothetical protein [Tanacetum cinerariifolium]GFB56962.1 hypothetical protein [Tanacetum cinerariifolium]